MSDQASVAASPSSTEGVEESRRHRAWQRARSVESAAIAGILFGVLLIVALALFRSEPESDAVPSEIAAWLARDDAAEGPLTALYLTSFAVIAFLWFVAVIRRRIGQQEDRFFATVFLGSGLLTAGVLLVGSALIATPALVVNMQSASALDVADYPQLRAAGEALFTIHGMRFFAVFMITTSTVVLRAEALPRWLAILGYLSGLTMLVSPPQIDEIYIFPAWVMLVSVFMLVRRNEIPAAEPDAGAASAEAAQT